MQPVAYAMVFTSILTGKMAVKLVWRLQTMFGRTCTLDRPHATDITEMIDTVLANVQIEGYIPEFCEDGTPSYPY